MRKNPSSLTVLRLRNNTFTIGSGRKTHWSGMVSTTYLYFHLNLFVTVQIISLVLGMFWHKQIINLSNQCSRPQISTGYVIWLQPRVHPQSCSHSKRPLSVPSWDRFITSKWLVEIAPSSRAKQSSQQLMSSLEPFILGSDERTNQRSHSLWTEDPVTSDRLSQLY